MQDAARSVTPAETGPCPVCRARSRFFASVGGRALLHCVNCGLHFYAVDDELPPDLYVKAYEGTVSDAHMGQFEFRARHLFSSATDFAAAPALKLSVRWLRDHAEPDCFILDIGCGRGTMLRLLRSAGFGTGGLDLSPTVAAILAQQGFHVHAGPVASYPDMQPYPDYVTCNFVLHHPRDPMAFLADIRDRFPTSPLLLTERLSFPNWMEQMAFVPRNWPEYPRDLTAWTRRALAIALTSAGYARQELHFTQPSPHDTMLPLQNWLTSRFARSRSRGPARVGSHGRASGRAVVLAMRALRLVRAAVYGGQALYARLSGLAPASVLIVAYPDDSFSSGHLARGSAP